jgi:nuclear pore complex protein Nup107
VLKSACRSWEDHAWAQISVICEEKQSSEIDSLGGSYWEGGLAALEQGVRDLEPQEEEEEAIEWEREVLLGLESLASVRVEDG